MTRLYTPEEFVGTDGRYWPSIQELKRRGKNFAIIANEIVTSGYQQYHPVLFSETIQNDGDYANNQVQVSLPGSSDPYPGASSTPPIYLWRVYPAGNLATDTTWDGHWDKYVSRGFNFVANNVLDDGDRVTDVRTQAPEPTYLDLNTSASRNWGTRAYPFRAFDAAYWRASPMTTIKLKPATYTLFFTNVLSKSVVLKKDGTEASNPIITKP